MVRNDLTSSQQAVQAGHALADYIREHSEECQDYWNNTLVYLTTRDKESLEFLELKMSNDDIKYTLFQEPDIGNEATAIASLGNNKHFKKMGLL